MDAGGSILVVEDSDEDFEAMRRAFRKAEMTWPVRRCVDGDDALAYLQRKGIYAEAERAPRPSLIVLDLNLPGTDGREVLEQIKGDDATRTTPVVVLTTSSSPRDIDACYRSGASSYVIKPVDFDKFLAAIRALKDYWLSTVTLPGVGV